MLNTIKDTILFPQARFIFEVEIGHIERVDAGAGRGMDDAGPRIKKRLPGLSAAQIGRKVDRADYQGINAWGRFRDFLDPLEPLIGSTERIA